MADRVKIVEIQVNAQQSIRQIAQYNQLIDEEKKKQKDLKKGLDDGRLSQRLYARQMAASNETVKNYRSTVSTLSRQVQSTINVERQQVGSLNQMRTVLQQATRAYDAMSAAERNSARGQELKAKINVYTDEVRKAENETQRFYRNAGNTQNVANGFDKLKSSVSGVGRELAMLAGAATLSQLGKNVVEITRQFDDGMARVHSVLNADADTMQVLTDKARELGRTTMFHATDAAQAMENLARGGFNAQESLDAVTTSLQLAQANAVDLDTSSDILIRTMRGFGMAVNPEELTHAADILSSSAANSATNITEVGEALKNAAPPASALKIPIEEINAALMVLADRGVRGSDAGTAMRMLLLGIAEPTSKAAKVFKEYGISINQAELSSKGLAGVLETLNNAGIMKNDNFLSKLSTIFGRRAVMNVVSILDNLDQYKDKLDILGNSAGTNARMFDQALSQQSLSLYTLSSAWEDMMITMGEEAAPTVTKIADSMTQGIYFVQEHFTTLVRIISEAIAGFSLYKLVRHVQASMAAMATTTKASLDETTVARQMAEQKAIMLKQQEVAVTNQLEAQKAGTVKMSEQEVTMAKERQTLLRERLATQQKSVETLAAKETALQNQVAAAEASSAWKRGALLAKTAWLSFLSTMKTMMVSMGWMAAVTLAIEGIVRLVSAVKNLKSHEQQYADFKKNLNSQVMAQNDALQKASNDNTAQEIGNITRLHKKVKDYNLSIGERREAIKKLESLVPGYHAHLSREGRLYEQNVQSINKYVKALREAAMYEAAKDMMKENDKKILQSQIIQTDAGQKRGALEANTQKKYGVNLAKGERVQERRSVVGTSSSGAVQTAVTSYVIVGADGKDRTISDKDAKTVMRNQNWYDKKFADRIEMAQETERVWTKQQDVLDKVLEKNLKSAQLVESQHKKNGAWGSTNFFDDTDTGGEASTGSGKSAGKGGGSAKSKETKETKKSSSETMTEEEKKAAEKAAKKAKREAEKKRKAEERAAKEAERKTIRQEKLETKYYNIEGKAEVALVQETWASKRAIVEQNYNSQINTLRVALKTEKDLTQNAREAINRTIVALEEKKRQELEKLSDEELKATIAREQKLLDARLAIVKKGSEEEYALRKEQREKEQQLNKVELDNEEETNIGKAKQDTDDARFEYDEAADNMNSVLSNEKSTDEEVKAAIARYDAALSAKRNAEDKETSMVQYYSDLRAAIAAKAQSDELKAEQEHQEKLREVQYKAVEDRIALMQQGYDTVHAELETELTKRYETIVSQGQLETETREEYETRKNEALEALRANEKTVYEQQQMERRSLEAQGIEMTTSSEMEALQAQRDLDQQRYEDLLTRGQLETQTEQEYQDEVKSIRESAAKSQEAVNNAETKNEQAKGQAFKNVGQSTIDIINAVGESSETAAKIGKVVALAEIAINTGKAIAEGTAQAMKLGWPAAIPAIATMVATVLANIATAISSVKSAKFAKGGKVVGAGTGTSDSIPAQLSNGEYVMTAKATRMFEPLLAAMNGIGAGVPMQVSNSYREVENPETYTESFVVAAQEIRPVVSVEEITDTQNRVEIIHNLGSI